METVCCLPSWRDRCSIASGQCIHNSSPWIHPWHPWYSGAHTPSSSCVLSLSLRRGPLFTSPLRFEGPSKNRQTKGSVSPSMQENTPGLRADIRGFDCSNMYSMIASCVIKHFLLHNVGGGYNLAFVHLLKLKGQMLAQNDPKRAILRVQKPYALGLGDLSNAKGTCTKPRLEHQNEMGALFVHPTPSNPRKNLLGEVQSGIPLLQPS